MLTRRRRLFVLLLLAAGLVGGLYVLVDLTPDSEVRDSIEGVKSLPYLSWSRAEVIDGPDVAIHLPDRVSPGINLYASEVEPGARFLGMDGRVVGELHDRRAEPTIWKLAKPLADGTFGILAAGGTVMRIDRRSRILFEHTDALHHDFDFTADGFLVAPVWRTRKVPEIGWLRSVKDDFLTAVDSAGREQWALSMADAVVAEPQLLAAARKRADRLLDWQKDTLHTNTITVLPRTQRYAGGLVFPAGAVLTCWRNLDTVAVIDVSRPSEGARVLWHWGLGELELPHHPRLLDSGNMLIFDNGTRRGWSRVVEIDPATGEIVWEYRAEPPEDFYSSSRGSAQRLANGNTLIVESQRGRAFEVTPDGDTVWDFLDPRTRVRGLTRTAERATIYRMERLPLSVTEGPASP